MKTYKSVPFYDADITGGFWQEKQRINADKTIPAVRDRFAETGRIAAFKCDWKEGEPNRPHIFWDSDVAKWMESAAYLLEKEKHPEFEELIDEITDDIEKNRWEDGYYNSYFTVCEPEKRFTNRDWHELYCLGHLIEAAVAYNHATGKDKLLHLVCDYADLVYKIFKEEDSAGFHTPGHEEIELALVKLYKATGNKKYLDLSKYFIDRRGMQLEVPNDFWCVDKYFQSHIPVREQTEAGGHAVRAVYLYSGMADIAAEYGDEALKKACLTLFDDIYYKKMYVTGGIGQSYAGEAFTIPYDLENATAYTETCAAIGLCFFAHRLQLLSPDSRFADVIERCIYNGAISGVSLDGQSFFYKNPLEIIHARRERNISVPKDREHYPETRRQKVFGCSCCPPNITRFISSVADYICTYDEDRIFIHQYMSSTLEIPGEENIRISQKTDYPYDGRIEIVVKNAKGREIALRIPGYCDGKYGFAADDVKENGRIENGYLIVTCKSDIVTMILDLDVSPKLLYTRPEVWADAGYACVEAGPLIYCAEAVDNGENLRALRFSQNQTVQKVYDGELSAYCLIVDGKRQTTGGGDLYSHKISFEDTKIKLIPFFTFANRAECDMAVWLPTLI